MGSTAQSGRQSARTTRRGTSERPIVNILGERVALGPVCRGLYPTYQRWLNDFSTLRTMGIMPRPFALEPATADIEHDLAGQNNVVFAIYEAATWQVIGIGGWADIDHRNQTAQLVLAIWEPARRGQGYGTEATRLLVEYAFTVLGLHSAMLRVNAFNLAGIRAYEKAGFREFGRRRQCVVMGGQLWDTVYMECLATGFTSPVLERVFTPDQPRS